MARDCCCIATLLINTVAGAYAHVIAYKLVISARAQGVRALKDQQTASAIRIQTIERRRQGRKAYFEKMSKPKVAIGIQVIDVHTAQKH